MIHQNFERILHFRVCPGSMFVSVSVNTNLFYRISMKQDLKRLVSASFLNDHNLCIYNDKHNIKVNLMLTLKLLCVIK
jgi:hypothetical protein